MISRIEFYAAFSILCGIIILAIWSTDFYRYENERAKIETRDSVLQVQKDSALARAIQYELRADSLQAVVNRKKLDMQIIHKKYETEKKNVLVLNADSTLSYFLRTTGGN